MADKGQLQPQPDFKTVADTMDDMSRSPATLAIQSKRMRNVPALDGGALILAELRVMRQEMRDMERRMTTRLEAA